MNDDDVDNTNNMQADNVKVDPAHKVRTLICETYKRVINPYQKARKEIEEQYAMSIETIDKQLKEKKSIISKEFDVVNAKVKAQVDRFNNLVGQAETYVRDTFGAKIGEDDSFSSEMEHNNPEEEAKHFLQVAGSVQSDIASIEKPWDGGKCAWVAFGIFIVTVIAYFVLDNPPANFVFFVFFAPLSVLLQPLLARRSAKKYIPKLRKNVAATRHWLGVWLEQARMEAEGKWKLEQQSANAGRKRVEEEFQESLSALRNQFAPILDDLRGRIIRFTEEIGVRGAVWDAPIWQGQEWMPASASTAAVRLGHLYVVNNVENEKSNSGLPMDKVGRAEIESGDVKEEGTGIESVDVKEVKVGQVYIGKVEKITDFGAFFTILPGKVGLVHISQICDEHVQNVSDKLSLGDQVKVKVLEVDGQGRIRLSMKAVGPDENESAGLELGYELGLGDEEVNLNVHRVCSDMLELNISLPALIPFTGDGRSLLFNTSGSEKSMAVAAVEGLILRLLATLLPGKLRLTFIDPVGLGQQVAGFMGLADHDESLITGKKVWTDPSHIEQRLAELTEHMENVIQNKLRTEYATIEDYNGKAGKTAEPYRLLVIMDFPVNFTEAAARRLVSIVENGPRCGVHTVIIADQDKPLPYGFKLADLERNATVFKSVGDHFVWRDRDFKPCRLELDKSPPDDLVKMVIETIGPLAVDAMKVEVPFESLCERYHIGADTGWGDATTQNGIEIPLGPSGAQTNQILRLGVGLENHALMVGRPGSGKSNLMHVIITGMALKYPPSELELYLVDFKGGVEFKPYGTHRLPHARAVAIESEREFGISILRRLDVEMDRRQTIFRKAGVRDLAHYREQEPDYRMPRIVLLVDEFQDFFAADDRITGEAREIFDHLVRKGRNAGLHIILGSQSISGNTLLATTVNLITIRIALQCSDADSRAILAEGNSAARMLTRPGEAIYNNQGGLLEGNRSFQVARYTEQDHSVYLPIISSWANAADGDEAKFIEDSELTVFEGNELPHIEACKPLMELLTTKAPIESSPRVPQIWLGEAIEIRPPVSLRLHQQSEANILIVSREEEEGAGLCLSAQISLLAQQREGDALIYNFDLTTADAAWAEHAEEIRDRYGKDRVQVLGRRDAESALAEVDKEVQRRIEAGGSGGGAPILVVFQGLHRIRDLRGDGGYYSELEEGSPRFLLARILKDGPEVGVHTIAWADTLTNVKRCVDDRALREFGYRIAGALSREDSQDLLDAPDASRISKPHRFLLFEEERPGVLTLFRPYAIPDLDGFRELLESRTSP